MTATARSAPGASAVDPEAGFTMTELVVTLLVLLIAMTMTAMIGTVVFKNSSGTLRQGQAAERAQVAVSGLAQFLSGTATPQRVAQATGATPTSSGPCWGTSQSIVPSGSQVAGNLAAAPNVPQNLAIIYAHDFNVEFCAYPATGAPTPHIYQIALDTSTCSGSDGYCTVVVKDLGTSWNAADYPATPTSLAAQGTVVDTITDVWCDTACQSGWACSSYPTDSSKVPYTTAPASCGATSTPPLFQYAGTSGASGAPLNDYCAPIDLSTDPFATGQSPGPGPCHYSAAPSGAADAAGLFGIESVTISVTVLSNTNTALSSPNGRPGSTMTQQVWLVSA